MKNLKRIMVIALAIGGVLTANATAQVSKCGAEDNKCKVAEYTKLIALT